MERSDRIDFFLVVDRIEVFVEPAPCCVRSMVFLCFKAIDLQRSGIQNGTARVLDIAAGGTTELPMRRDSFWTSQGLTAYLLRHTRHAACRCFKTISLQLSWAGKPTCFI